ncbi:MAG TPA: DinB family protein [Bryobacteraceae bacterium]|nr:DinB family protein [Bryobacteraceae bacterium]
MIRLEHVTESWRGVRQDTVAAVEEFPESEFGFRATPEMQTFGEIARHILTASQGLTAMVLAGESDFTGPDFRARLMKYLKPAPPEGDAQALAAALRDSLESELAELAAKPADFLAQEVTRMDGVKLTRLEMIQSIKEHEMTHRSQMFMYMRLKGIVPLTTRRRLARLAKQNAS